MRAKVDSMIVLMDPIANARRLRRSQTLAESRLWTLLRGRRLHGFKFRRQVPIDRYIADFMCREANLIVELDGASHEDRVEQDALRTVVLERCGFRVLRFDNELVLTDPGGVADAICAALRLKA
jgi:very-short-patch-repair endonuclease